MVQWLTPYGLVYLLLGASWAVFGPLHAGRMGALLLALMWVGAVHWLAWRRRRSSAAAVLATVVVFNHTLYWGFLSFVAGWPLFVLWLEETSGERARSWRPATGLRLLGCGALLYFTHALWFAFAGLWLALRGLVDRLPWKVQLLRLASLTPLAVVALLWFPRLAERRFETPPMWVTNPLQRLLPREILDSALGGLQGTTEPLILSVLLGWVLFSVAHHRREWPARADRGLLLAAGLFFVLYLMLPDKFMNTIQFGQRWLPFALVSLLLASPPPPLRSAFRKAIATAVLAAFCGATALTWVTFERVELAGLREALEALPPAPRVLGLDYVRHSPRIKESPFLQAFAWAQVWKGGELNFSFADFAPSPVIYREPRVPPWTVGLEWMPFSLRLSDLRHFDFVILHGDEPAHLQVATRANLEPVTNTRPWALYRVAKPPPQ